MHPSQFNLTKIAYTSRELIDLGVVGSHMGIYRAVNAGKLRLTKQGSRTIFLATDLADFIASLPASKGDAA